MIANDPSATTAGGSLVPGAVLNEYRLVEKLGTGGMGTVYRALHARLEKEVALKLIQPLREHDPQMRSRFEREMKAIGKLRDPHIVLATDAGEAAGLLYLVMELEQGVDLAAYAREAGRLPIREACEYVRQAALGLQCAHEAGLVHRDVKPSNLFRTSDGQIKLLDLGLAMVEFGEEPTAGVQTPFAGAAMTDSRPMGSACTVGPMGTDEYMAPEQWTNAQNVDAKADLYSLGCTLFFLLTGQPPFGAPRQATRVQIRQAHLQEAPPGLRTVRPDAPAKLEALVNRLLAKRPEERGASAASVARELSAFVRAKSTRRRSAVAGLLLAIACLAVIKLTMNRPTTDAPSPTAAPVAAAASKPAEAAEPAEPVREQVVLVRPPRGALPMTEEEAQHLQRDWAHYLKRPTVFTNSLGMPFALIPPGEFKDVDSPFMVIEKPYYLGLTEVTVRQFRQFVDDTGYLTQAERDGQGGMLMNVNNSGRNSRNPLYIWSRPGVRLENEDFPAMQVTWDDGMAYCAWLSGKESAIYRLQTAMEWVWAARAGIAEMTFPEDRLVEYAWFKGNSENRPHPVATRRVNPWGLYDLHGNVGEWALDDFNIMRSGRIIDAPIAATGASRIYLGSAYTFTGSSFRVHSNRGLGSHASTAMGFRVVCELPQPADAGQ